MKKYFSFAFIILLSLNGLLFAQKYVEEYNRALDYYNNGHYYNSISILEPIYSSEPYNINTSLLLIDNYLDISNYIKAKEIINKLKAYYPQNVLPLERELKVNILENNEEGALSLIRTITGFDNKNYKAKYYEALLAEKKGYFDNAIKLYEDAIRLNSDGLEAVFALSILYNGKGQSKKSIDMLIEKQKLNLDNAQIYYNLANIYYLNNNLARAQSQIDQALRLNDNYIDALVLNANIKAKNGQYDEAINIIRSIDNSYLGLDKYLMIANLYDVNGAFDSALENYRTYLRENANDEVARYLYENILLSSTNDNLNSQKQSAASYYKKLSEKYTKSGDGIRSFLYNKKILKLNPTDINARINMASLYKRLGYNEKYLEELGIVKNLVPENKSIANRYENDFRNLMRANLSRKWGISQYGNIAQSGFAVAISPYVNEVFGLGGFSDSAIKMSLSDVFNQYNRFTTVDKFVNSNMTRPAFLSALNQENISFYIDGNFRNTQNSISMDINLIDANSGKIIKNVYTITYGKERLINSSINVAQSISVSIPFYANIIKVDDGALYINAGKWQSLTNGQKFAIYSGKPLYDYSTGGIYTNNISMIGFATIAQVDENVSRLLLDNNSVMKNIEVGQFVVNYTNE